MKNCVAVFLVTCPRQIRQKPYQRLPFPAHEFRDDFVAKAAIQVFVAGDKAAVNQRNRELNIVVVELLARQYCAYSRTHTNSQVPHLPAEAPQNILELLFARLCIEQKKEIYVRMRQQHAP